MRFARSPLRRLPACSHLSRAVTSLPAAHGTRGTLHVSSCCVFRAEREEGAERSPEVWVWEGTGLGMNPANHLHNTFCPARHGVSSRGPLLGRVGSPSFAGHVTCQAPDPSCDTYRLPCCCNHPPPPLPPPPSHFPTFPLVSKGTGSLSRTTVRGSWARGWAPPLFPAASLRPRTHTSSHQPPAGQTVSACQAD